jgi:threonine synthase
MDVGNHSNFERLIWLYKGRLEGAQHDMEGCHYADDEVRATIRQVHERTGYILDPHSAIGYLGITSQVDRARRAGRPGIFLATAHPAKFPEVVEPVIGRAIEKPPALANALSRAQTILKIDATLAAVREAVGA